MAVSIEPVRRRRYTRATTAGVTLTPQKLTLLNYVVELGIASLPQLAKLACPSEKSARRHLRELYDAGLVEVIPVSRAALALPGVRNDASLLYGSAPNVYTISRAGVRELRKWDLIDDAPSPVHYGPQNSLFLAHELAIRDVRVWFEMAARDHPGLRLEKWRDGGAAEISLEGQSGPKVVRPDAWLVFRLQSRVLISLTEIDRGTERGSKRWGEKLAAYQSLFASGRLVKVTGYTNARILVFATGERRRDHLAEFVSKHADPQLAARFWFVDLQALDEATLVSPHWRLPGSVTLTALLSPSLVNAPKGE